MKPIVSRLREVIDPSTGKRTGAWSQAAGKTEPPRDTNLQFVAGRLAVESDEAAISGVLEHALAAEAGTGRL